MIPVDHDFCKKCPAYLNICESGPDEACELLLEKLRAIKSLLAQTVGCLSPDIPGQEDITGAKRFLMTAMTQLGV